jgi:hypothetical protein
LNETRKHDHRTIYPLHGPSRLRRTNHDTITNAHDDSFKHHACSNNSSNNSLPSRRPRILHQERRLLQPIVLQSHQQDLPNDSKHDTKTHPNTNHHSDTDTNPRADARALRRLVAKMLHGKHMQQPNLTRLFWKQHLHRLRQFRTALLHEREMRTTTNLHAQRNHSRLLAIALTHSNATTLRRSFATMLFRQHLQHAGLDLQRNKHLHHYATRANPNARPLDNVPR